jgi:hypothetical protein
LEGVPRPSGSGIDIGALERPAPQASGLTARYRFDETGGASAADFSGSGQHAAYVNQPVLGAPGAIAGGTSVSLNGLNQYVALPRVPFGDANSAGSYTLSFETWFRAAPGSSGVILSQAGAGAAPGGAIPSGYVPVVHLGADGRVRSSLYWHGDANRRLVSPGAAYSDGRWHHVAVTYANGVETLYLDGVLAGQQAQPIVPYAPAYDFFLGTGQTSLWEAGNGGWHFFNGQLDEAGLYSRALTPAEIAEHFAAGDTADSAAQYHFDESSGAVAADSSGGSQHATYVNQPVLGTPGVGGSTAAEFNGVNQYVALPQAAFGDANQGNIALSFETWFRAAPGASGVILSQTAAGATPGGATPAGYVPVVHLGADGKVRSSLFWHGDVNSRLVSPGAAAYNDGQWHHVAVTYAAGVETLYLDGVLIGQQTRAQVPYAAAYSYFLGTGQTSLWPEGNGGWHFFSGSLDEAAIYQRALTPGEVAARVAAQGV